MTDVEATYHGKTTMQRKIMYLMAKKQERLCPPPGEGGGAFCVMPPVTSEREATKMIAKSKD